MKYIPFHYFSKAFCINLVSRPDRWYLVQREFKRAGIINFVEQYSVTKHKHPMIGCTINHLQIIKQAKADHLDSVLIFEDDVRFLEIDKIFLAIEELKLVSWDMFFIGSTMSKPCELTYVSPHLVKSTSGGVRGSHAYAVNSSAYDTILDFPWEFEGHNAIKGHHTIDRVYQKRIMPSINCYQANPIQAIQAGGYSNIGDKTIDLGRKQLQFARTIPIQGLPK